MNGCSECRGTGIALYELIQNGAVRPWGKHCRACGTFWRIEHGLVVVSQEPVEPLRELPEELS